MRRTPWIAAAAALVALICAPAALADSIAYVKDGDVWLSEPDGARQYQVTYTGGYSDVSQADDGTMIALNGVRLRKLDRAGNVLADFDTPVSDTRPAPSKTFYGPFDPAISPDGSKVAYTYYYMTQSQNPGCFPPECVVAINEAGTGYSWADRQTSWDEPGLGYHSGWRHPAWVDNDMTMLSNPSHMPNNDVILDRISDGGNGHGNMVLNWFSDLLENNPHVSGGDISRDKTKLAFQTGDDDSTLTIYSVPKFPTTWKDGDVSADQKPLVCYRYGGAPGGKFSVPTLAADGSRVAWAAGDGIHIASIPSFAGGCTLTGATPTPPLVIPGGAEPDWGPADVPAARAAPGTPQQPAASRPAGSGGGGAPGKPAKLSVTVTRAAHGVTLKVKVASKGRLSATAKAKGKVVGKAAKRITKGGPASLKIRVKGHPKSVSLAVTFKPATGETLKGSATAKLKD
jgi:hypothetical protein